MLRTGTAEDHRSGHSATYDANVYAARSTRCRTRQAAELRAPAPPEAFSHHAIVSTQHEFNGPVAVVFKALLITHDAQDLVCQLYDHWGRC